MPLTYRTVYLHDIVADMWMLTYLHRCAIAKILDKKDHGRAWMDFARRIGVEKLIPAFEIQPSPTLNLLEYFEVMFVYWILCTLVVHIIITRK